MTQEFRYTSIMRFDRTYKSRGDFAERWHLVPVLYIVLSMAFSINGTLERGINSAHESIAKQLPFVTREFPEIANCYSGTLNLRLDLPLLVLVPDHRTKPIPWHPLAGDGEVFDILRIRLEAPMGAAPIPAWFYIAHLSLHRADLHLHEVVTQQKLTISQGDTCRIHVDRHAMQLQYAALPLVIVV